MNQGRVGSDLPISYASRTLNAGEMNYSTIEKELLAVLFGVEHFRPYLYGQQFTLITDHRSLVWLHNAKDPTSKLMRWRIRLNEYDYNIVYKPGKANSNADALSRNPVDPCQSIVPRTPNAPTDDTIHSDSADPERVLACTDMTPFPDSMVDGTNDKNTCNEIEVMVASVFLVREKIEADNPEALNLQTDVLEPLTFERKLENSRGFSQSDMVSPFRTSCRQTLTPSL